MLEEAVDADLRQLRFDREPLRAALAAVGHRLGDPAHIRIFKEQRELELWLSAGNDRRFRLFRIYPIAGMSGELGPKLAEGDRQAPEGFYAVGLKQLNPRSRHHLAFNLGYPNAHDRQLGRTGSFIMVHGGTQSAGCFAVTDAGVDDIYTIVAAALESGQGAVTVASFPFRMTAEALAARSDSPWRSFWEDLAGEAEHFASAGVPPVVSARDGRYCFGNIPPGAEPIVGWA